MNTTHTIAATDLKVDEEWGRITIDGTVHVIDWFDIDRFDGQSFVAEIHTTDGHTVIVEGW